MKQKKELGGKKPNKIKKNISRTKKKKYLDGRLPADNCRPLTIVRDARSEDIVR